MQGYILNKVTGLRESYFDLPHLPEETATHSFHTYDIDEEGNAIVPELQKPPKTKEQEEYETVGALKQLDAEYGPRYVREYFIANNLITDVDARKKLQDAETLAVSKRQELETIKAK